MESDSGEGHGKTWIEDGGCRGESGMEETAVGSQREKTAVKCVKTAKLHEPI